ncbi:MAG: NTP transferase domain-containing protein [Bdellovibrionales bacterium]|nr:NTP transferase domain-containing protein [Bdellovibrionales bacterium]
MAAGLGTRLRPFSESIPKPLTPILGVPSSAFALDALRLGGVDRVVANLHYLPRETEQGLLEICGGLKFSDETASLLGSAGGIKKALPALEAFGGSSSFFIVNADTLCSLQLDHLAATHERLKQTRGVTITMALLNRESISDQRYREILIDPTEELVIGLGQQTGLGKMYTGVAVLEPEALANVPDGIPSDFVDTILRPEMSANRVGAHHFSGLWLDVGSPKLWWEAHLQVMRQFEENRLPHSWKGLIEKEAKTLGRRVWTRRTSSLDRVPEGWVGPCYWDGRGSVPKSLGPRSIFYGSIPEGLDPSDAIGAAGHWIKF